MTEKGYSDCSTREDVGVQLFNYHVPNDRCSIPAVASGFLLYIAASTDEQYQDKKSDMCSVLTPRCEGYEYWDSPVVSRPTAATIDSKVDGAVGSTRW